MTLLHSLTGHDAHLVLEMLAYLVGARIYWGAVRAQPLDPGKVARDVTDQRRSQLELRQTAQRLSLAMAAANSLVLSFTAPSIWRCKS